MVLVDGVQAEKELSEVNLQLESMRERLDEADGLSSAQVPIATHPHVILIYSRHHLHHHHSSSLLLST